MLDRAPHNGNIITYWKTLPFIPSSDILKKVFAFSYQIDWKLYTCTKTKRDNDMENQEEVRRREEAIFESVHTIPRTDASPIMSNVQMNTRLILSAQIIPFSHVTTCDSARGSH